MSLQIADVDKLKCRFFALIKKYVQSITYGITCDKDAILDEADMVLDYINIAESGCDVDTCNIERYLRTSLIEFCKKDSCVTVYTNTCGVSIEIIESPKIPCKPMTIQII